MISFKPLDISVFRFQKVRLSLPNINKTFKSMMYCSSEETKTSNIYRLATILLFFLKKKVKCVSTSSHTLFFFFKFLWLQKMGQQHVFSLIFPLNPEVRGRSLGQRSFGRWWRHEVCVRVRVVLSLLSVRRRCTSVNELEEHLLGDRVGDTVAHSCGKRETRVSCEGS